MELKSFQVSNYRSITDSGEINVTQITSILGRNESGKSNLLRALFSVNPSGGIQPYNRVKDFPRSLPLTDCTDHTRVIETTWSLSAQEKLELSRLYKRASATEVVTVGRNYGAENKASRWISFGKLLDFDYATSAIDEKVSRIASSVKPLLKNLDAEQKKSIEGAVDDFVRNVKAQTSSKAWAESSVAGIDGLVTALASVGRSLQDESDLEKLRSLSNEISRDDELNQEARNWVASKLPIFVFLDEYPSLSGHQNIAEYLTRKENKAINDSDSNFEKLCIVAGLDPVELQALNNAGDHERRNQLANRASANVTKEVKRLWKDRSLKVRFNLDAHFMDTLISDPNSVYDVEVNLNERSRGFQWFLSFYIAFAADTKGLKEEDAILLLDEPGLYLHAKSQSDLLNHFSSDFKNKIIYTTHSPFMVPVKNLEAIRTVSIDEDLGTRVSNDPTGDARTLFPLQAALGYDLSQSLFVGPKNLVVEGVTDFWILSSISNYLNEQSSSGLSEDIVITPAGGAQKVSYMVTLLSSQELNVVVLLDLEGQSVSTKDELVRSKLIADKNIVFVSDGNSSLANSEADIEDLLDPKVYESLIKESYKKELKGISLVFNGNIPRIAKRYERAFESAGLKFNKTRAARLFLTKMSSEPSKVLTSQSALNFESLFRIINERIQNQSMSLAKATS